MATHATPASMLKESLDEYLETAKFCCDYKKSDGKWDKFQGNSCLGFPAAVLLFSIIDSIGSYFRKDKSFKIKIGAKDSSINSDGWEHFKILNSKYFGQNMSQEFMKAIYSKFRSPLIHNSVLGKNTILISETGPINEGIERIVFGEFLPQENLEHHTYLVNLQPLYELCKNAVEKFKKDIDEVVPNSKQGKNFN